MKTDNGEMFYRLTTKIHDLMQIHEFTNKKCYNLGRVECNLLQFLATEKKPLTMKEIATSLNVSHSRITHLVDALIHKGYITRTSSVDDRRIYYAQITEAGVEMVTNYRELTIKKYDELINQLPEEEQKLIFDSLKKWKEFLIERRREMIVGSE